MIAKAITYTALIGSSRNGIRNGNWQKLRFLDKALYRAAMWYAKHSGSIVNEMLVEKLLVLIGKLKETKGLRIFRRGLKKAVAILEKGEENGVFAWASSLRYWRKDPSYVFWLDTTR
jgi:hypothetical protein